MEDYYIRTPEQDESRGPFDISKLITLAEASQITPNTLYYDEDKEEWIPIVVNEELHERVFPEPEKLSLKIQEEKVKKKKSKAEVAIDAEEILAQSEGNTDQKRKIVHKKKSFERATSIAATGLGIMMILSSLFMILPLIPLMKMFGAEQRLHYILNFPTVLIGVFDLFVATLLLLAVTEVYPLARGRAMLGLGFGVYVGWALGDPIIMGASAAAGFGIFLATYTQRLSLMIFAFILGMGGNGFLVYLALQDRFKGFYEAITLNLFGN